MAKQLLRIHRWLSLCLLVFWLMQALTGVLITFRWELDDYFLGGAPLPFDLQAFSERVLAVENEPDFEVVSVWASGGHADRYDLFLSRENGGSAVMRIDGAGKVLRIRSEDQWFAAGGIYDKATSLHANLLVGEIGHWLIALSGLLLFSNLVLGLTMAWPRHGQWRRSLTTLPTGSSAARIYGWHRLLGLCLAWPALGVVLFGSLLSLTDPLSEAAGWTSPQPDRSDPSLFQADWGSAPVTPAEAVQTALSLYRGAQFSGMYPPDDESPWYTVRLLTEAEPQRVYGKTAVVISPVTGEVLANQATTRYPVARQVVYAMFPLHTGQIIGLPGRLLGLLSGLFLLAMLVLGTWLYWKRRQRR